MYLCSTSNKIMITQYVGVEYSKTWPLLFCLNIHTAGFLHYRIIHRENRAYQLCNAMKCSPVFTYYRGRLLYYNYLKIIFVNYVQCLNKPWGSSVWHHKTRLHVIKYKQINYYQFDGRLTFNTQFVIVTSMKWSCN